MNVRPPWYQPLHNRLTAGAIVEGVERLIEDAWGTHVHCVVGWVDEPSMLLRVHALGRVPVDVLDRVDIELAKTLPAYLCVAVTCRDRAFFTSDPLPGDYSNLLPAVAEGEACGTCGTRAVFARRCSFCGARA